MLAETYGRNGIKKVVRSINPRRKGIILKISLPSSEVSTNRPAQAASRSSSIGIWLRAYESASRSVFERKASLPAINAKCLRKGAQRRSNRFFLDAMDCFAGARNDENSEGFRFLSARLRPPGLVSRTCAASAVAARCRFPGRVARSTIRQQPAGRRGMLAKLTKTKSMGRRPSGYWNSSPARAPLRRGRRSNP